MNIPHITGEKLNNPKNALPTILDANVAIGPITINPSGKDTNNTNIGTKNVFTTSGIILANTFSSLAAK